MINVDEIEVRSLKYNAVGGIDMEINHPEYGWVPFTAAPDDVVSYGGQLYSKAAAGDFGSVLAYVGPTPEQELQTKREKSVLSPMQFKLNLDAAGYMPAIEAYLADPATPNSFRIMWSDASSFERLYPALVTAAADLNLTDEQLDAVFGI